MMSFFQLFSRRQRGDRLWLGVLLTLCIYLCNFLSSCSWNGRVWTEFDVWHTGFDIIPSGVVHIPSELILPVSMAGEDRAISLVTNENAVALTQETMFAIFLGKVPHADDLLHQAEKRIRKRIKDITKMAENPFFSDSSPSMLAEVRELTGEMHHVKQWQGKLRPILVRGLVLDGAVGNFSAWQHSDSLWVQSVSLAKRALPMKRQPVIIFLESVPKNVFIQVESCE